MSAFHFFSACCAARRDGLFGVGDDMDFFGTVNLTLPKLTTYLSESEHIGMRLQDPKRIRFAVCMKPDRDTIIRHISAGTAVACP